MTKQIWFYSFQCYSMLPCFCFTAKAWKVYHHLP